MTVKEVVELFRSTFPDLEIGELRRVGEWFVFTISNAPKEKVGLLETSIDPFIGYNINTKQWNRLSAPMLGVKRFFGAKPIPFE